MESSEIDGNTKLTTTDNSEITQKVNKSAPILKETTNTIQQINSQINSEKANETNNEEAILKNLAPQTLPNSVWKRRSAGFNIGNIQFPGSSVSQNSFQKLKNITPIFGDSTSNNQQHHNGHIRNTSKYDTNENNAGKRHNNPDRRIPSLVNNIQELGNTLRIIPRSRNSGNFSLKDKRTPHPFYAPDDQELRTKRLASDLIASLLAGGPASLFAGTNFLKDSHGHKRAPILLAMLDVKIRPLRDINQYVNNEEENDDIEWSRRNTSRRHSETGSIISTRFFRNRINDIKDLNTYSKKRLFEISLEYGIDDYRSKWKIIKTYGSMMELHNRLKALSIQYAVQDILSTDRKSKLLLPKFPHKKKKSLHDSKYIEKDLTLEVSPRNSMASSDLSMSTTSMNSQLLFDINKVHLKHLEDLINEQDDYNQPIEKLLERYFRLLNLALCLRPEANLLIQYYEFSTISNLLSYEEGYKGKQGILMNSTSATAQGWKVPYLTKSSVKEIVQRHTTKWCLIRDSYIMYVSDIFSTTPLEVFLLDSKFNYTFSGDDSKDKRDISMNNVYDDMEWDLENIKKISTNLFIKLTNSERKLTFLCKSELSMRLWISSIAKMTKNCVWVGPKRFDSFAPVRKNAFAKFLVDGRDYFWSLSSALLEAEDVIYIHDWWLSPELYLRRPVSGNQEYRIDRILKKKAEQGVKIFIIVYRNVGKTVGTDSLWTKHSFLSLHKNIYIIRSPNQWRQNIFFWAHHEKFTVIDNTIAFMGGIDLCFGRYDTPEHALRDDSPDIKQQIFPGKDYSNARVSDFIDLDKPFESMYDRNTVCRMPWHDVHTMIIGEPARDMSRHFVQRWNYAIRRKRPSRPTPLLLPPIDFSKEELLNSPLFHSLKGESTCEIQILRSAGKWSLGLKETEHSIQNAYLKLIEQSEHYIYIENQFFVTTSSWDGVIIENRIGDAIVDRIIKAHVEKKTWKAFVIIPLMPGFDSPVDQPGASSLRVIVQCQYCSISRGPTSIFGKLQKLGINPHEYIHFFSLRKWSTFGPDNLLKTEQLYVHAKLLIVDDRSCIIGSANINERSQLGNRDSEIAAIIRDTATVKSKMNGKPYVAGKFPLELRQRLMREHMGCDVDLVDIVERKFSKLSKLATLNYKTLNTLSGTDVRQKDLRDSALIELAYREVFGCEYSPAWEQKYGIDFNATDTGHYGVYKRVKNDVNTGMYERELDLENFDNPSVIPSIKNFKKKKVHTFNYRAGTDNIGVKSNKEVSKDPRLVNNHKHEEDINGNGPDEWNKVTKEFKSSVTKQLQEWAKDLMTFKKTFTENAGSDESKNLFLPFKEDLVAYINNKSICNEDKWDMLKRIHYLQYLNHKESSGKNFNKSSSITIKSDLPTKKSNIQEFYNDDGNNRDEELENLLRKQLPSNICYREEKIIDNILNLNFVDPYSFSDPVCPDFFEDIWFCTAVKNTTIFRMVFHCQPDDSVTTWRAYKSFNAMYNAFERKQTTKMAINSPVYSEKNKPIKNEISMERNHESKVALNSSNYEGRQENTSSIVSKERANFPSYHLNELFTGYNDPIFNKQDAFRLLKKIKGHLVLFATEWLSEEVDSNNWFYNADRLVPIEVYN